MLQAMLCSVLRAVCVLGARAASGMQGVGVLLLHVDLVGRAAGWGWTGSGMRCSLSCVIIRAVEHIVPKGEFIPCYQCGGCLGRRLSLREALSQTQTQTARLRRGHYIYKRTALRLYNG